MKQRVMVAVVGIPLLLLVVLVHYIRVAYNPVMLLALRI